MTRRLAEQQADGVRYIDTETTGMGGAGAMVFMAGVARFDGATLRLRQYLLPGPHYEGGLLGGFADELEDATGLVSYNGKSFDVPSLEARAVLSRMALPLRELPHLDLLHPNRRLFKRQYDSYRLPEAEQRLLEFEREDDCPSHEAPERYFAFQRTGDPTHIAPVLRHNAWDVLSLVALTARLADECGGSGGAMQAARAAAYAGEWERAAGYYEAAAEAQARALRQEALEGLARSRWRSGELRAVPRTHGNGCSRNRATGGCCPTWSWRRSTSTGCASRRGRWHWSSAPFRSCSGGSCGPARRAASWERMRWSGDASGFGGERGRFEAGWREWDRRGLPVFAAR
ncbi:MAG: ribonuclease H-like domain-containing protein [Dehalococcoidia bacterium]|nr:ribonuclease H-like domain-containing protein [Dehalococcoidia bacterium]